MPFIDGDRPACPVRIHPSGAFAYVAEYNSNLDGGRVSAYAIDQATGTLTLVSHALAVPGYLPTAMAIGHSGAYAYVVNDAPSLPEQSGNVSVLAINGTTGALTPTALSPVQAGNEPLGIAIHPSGAYAYVTNSVSNDVSVYAIDSATGALTPIAGSPFPAGNYPSSIAITP
jgi:YVTN family beta-propeller protein